MLIEGAIHPTGAGFTREAWCRLVASRPEFRRRPPYQGINPFTQTETTYPTREDTAEVILDGRVVGAVGWSESEESLVNVRIEPVGMNLVEEWATALKGKFRRYPQAK